MMSDTIGLYPGNVVTRMGVPIGTIERIDSGITSVRVTFNLNSGVTIPQAVTAVTRSPSILADRNLELVGDNDDRASLRPDMCIPIVRTATPKSLSAGIAAVTTVVNQVNDAGGGDTVRRLVDAVSSQLSGNGAAVRDTLSALAGAVGDPGWQASADRLLSDLPGFMNAMNENWDSIDTILARLQGLDALSRRTVSALGTLLGPSTGGLIRVLLDVATTFHDVTWTTMDTATKTARLLAEHTGVIVMWAGTLPNIIDGIRSFWARLRGRTIPAISPRVAAGPSGDGQVCSQTDMDNSGKDHCGFFYGVPDGITTVDVLQLVLNGGVKRP